MCSGVYGNLWNRQARRRNTALAYIRVHDLRHTSATLLLLAGTPAKIVSERLGHASLESPDLYSHVLPDMQADAAAAMDGILDKAMNGVWITGARHRIASVTGKHSTSRSRARVTIIRCNYPNGGASCTELLAEPAKVIADPDLWPKHLYCHHVARESTRQWAERQAKRAYGNEDSRSRPGAWWNRGRYGLGVLIRCLVTYRTQTYRSTYCHRCKGGRVIGFGEMPHAALIVEAEFRNPSVTVTRVRTERLHHATSADTLHHVRITERRGVPLPRAPGEVVAGWQSDRPSTRRHDRT